MEGSDLWLPSWEPQPLQRETAREIRRQEIARAPKLIPVFSHRYIPSEPCVSGNPVFSVVGTDIIYYGFDLASYFSAEFGVPEPAWAAGTPRSIPYWTDLYEAVWSVPSHTGDWWRTT